MKVLLIRPPIYSSNLRFPSGPRFGLPTSLLYLAAAAREKGHAVSIYDALIDFSRHAVTQENGTGRYHIGASWETVAQRIRNEGPALVGITNPFSDYRDYTIRTARTVKSVDETIVTVVGGPHASAVPGDFLGADSGVDYVVQGEGEAVFPLLLDAIARGGDVSVNGVPSVSYRDHGTLRHRSRAPYITDLDSLPMPAYDLIDMPRYFDLVRQGFPSRFSFKYPGSEAEASIITSRGCPFSCVFCGNSLHMGKKWRYHSVEYVLRHMTLLITSYGVRHFHIEDDNLSLNTGRLNALLDGIIARGWDITWDTPNGIRADRLNEAIVEKMQKSGCTYIILGIESGNQRVLDTIIKKKLDIAVIGQTAAACKKARLDAHGFYVVGFPGETRADIAETFRYALRMLRRFQVVPHLGLARPLPGTELYASCRDKGYLSEPVLPDMGTSVTSEIFERIMITTDDFTPGQLERWVAAFNRKVVNVIVIQSFLWMIRHPVTAVRIIRYFLCAARIDTTLKRLFYSGLFYRNNYLTKKRLFRPVR